MLKGVDVSEWQGQIDWPTLSQHIDFAILRTSYGRNYQDKYIRRNQEQAEQNLALIGYYHYIHGFLDAQQEAQFFLNCVGEIKDGQPLFLDVEEDSHGLDLYVETMVQFIRNQTGIVPLVYMNHDYLSRYDWSLVVNMGCGLWLADWTGQPEKFTNPRYWFRPHFLQYTSDGSLPGVAGRLDTNSFFGDADDFKRFGRIKEGGDGLNDWIAIAYFNNYLQAWNPNAGICQSWMSELRAGRNHGPAISLEYQEGEVTFQRFTAGIAAWDPDANQVTWY